MKAAIFKETGLPEEVLKIEETATPEPGAGEIRIKVSACNINPSDVMFIQGLYGIRPKLPAVGGFEAAGAVDKCGEGVKMNEGTRVVFTAIGVWQEYVVVKAATVIPVPDSMPDEVACQAFVNPFTAYGMLQESRLNAGDFLLLTAGGSAFAKFVTQLASQRGIKVISTVRRDDLADKLKELGAAAVVNTETEDLTERVKELTEGKGVSAVFEAVGGKTGALALECLGHGGTMLAYGLLSLKPTPVNNGLILFKDLHIRGFWLTTWMNSLSREEMGKTAGEVIKLLATNDMEAYIEKTYPLDQVTKAIAHAEKPGRSGKIILTVS